MQTVYLSLPPEQILNDPLLNKGSAFTEQEREELGLQGMLPYHVSSLEEQVERRYHNFSKQVDPLSKYLFLSSLQNRNETLFYRLLEKYTEEMLPLIYTPTVGEVSLHYSSLYREHRGLYLSYPLKDKIPEILRCYPRKQLDAVVVTDGERVLGLGDLGVGGMAISQGKLALYTLFGGIHPGRTLPVFLDVGTDNPTLLEDPHYVGWRHERVRNDAYEEFVDCFVRALKKQYPSILLQWEDFAKANARFLLEKYRGEICSFNDDIQGTAAVAFSAIYSAVKSLKSTLKEQRIVIFGGGSAGIGIAQQIIRALEQEGLDKKEAYQRIYVIDIHGLLHELLPEGQSAFLDKEQRPFVRKKEEVGKWSIENPARITLFEVVQNVHPTILIGVSAQGGAFDERSVSLMARFVESPIIFPLSNPTTKSEACPEDLLKWTEGRALIATGSPFPPPTYKGCSYPIAQCNNVYIFPAMGLAAIAGNIRVITEEMFLTAAEALSENAPLLQGKKNSLFPPLGSLREVSCQIAKAIILKAQQEGVAPLFSEEELEKRIAQTIWKPHYPHYRRA